jgi:hypothetical protein
VRCGIDATDPPATSPAFLYSDCERGFSLFGWQAYGKYDKYDGLLRCALECSKIHAKWAATQIRETNFSLPLARTQLSKGGKKMPIPFGVIAVYVALAVWTGMLLFGLKRGAYGAFLLFGIALLIVLNARYAIERAPDSIAFFIGIYDVLDNLGASDPAKVAALATCPDNQCTVWGDRYHYHPSWGVAFYERFLHGSGLRTNLLYGHIFGNSLAFVLMMVQLFRPGNGSNPQQHRVLGYVSLVSLTVGVGCACILAAEHGSVSDYGGYASVYGFWFMSACVYVCAIMGIVSIRQRDFVSHRKWMFRYAGSMWGAFWLFRVMLFVLEPLLRNYNTATLLICIWFSAPLGIVIAEHIRRRMAHNAAFPPRDPLAVAIPR